MNAAVKNRILKRPEFRIGIVISTLMLVIAVIVLLFWLASRSLFSRNNHFAIKKIEMISTGWWKDKDMEVAKILSITMGKTNLFELNPAEIRNVLDKQPSVEKAVVSRIIPDTLRIEIVERIPRAFLYQPESQWLVDSNGIVMEARSCVNFKRNIPSITGFKLDRPMESGQTLSEVLPALDLIMQVVKKYPEIRIQKVNLGVNKEIQMSFMVSQVDITMNAIFPRTKTAEKLMALREVIKEKILKKEPATTFDLRFEGQVILKPPEIDDE